MIRWVQHVSRHSWFHNAILMVIALNAVLLGLETSATLLARYGALFEILNGAIQTIFVVEIAIRIIAQWPRPLGFFRDGWNVFDFVIVTVSLLPAAGSFANVARLARILRVTRLISVSDDLRLIVGTMLKSIPSLGHVGLLLGLLLYVYGILGFHLFHQVDPEHWGTLGVAGFSLFKMLTLEGWIEMHAAASPGHPLAWLFFSSFIVVAVFVVVNLFIAVVINNLDTVKEEQERLKSAASAEGHLLARITEIRNQLNALEASLKNR